MNKNNDPVIVKNFSCRYGPGGQLRLKQISMDVKLGEFIAVIGPSGGGKSTLAFSINGMIPHEIEGSETAGDITVMDMQVKRTQPHDLVRAVGTVLQDPEWQLVTFIVRDEISFALENLGVPVADIKKRVAALAPLLEISDLLDRSPDDLSGGQKQRVAIASCLAMEPPVLLLDEPMAELDPAGKQTVIDTVKTLNKDYGVTVIFIDHNLDILAPHADRVVVLSGGEIIENGVPAEVLANQKLLDEIRIRPPQSIEIAKLLSQNYTFPTYPLSIEELIDRMQIPHEISLKKSSKRPKESDPNNKAVVINSEDLKFKYPEGPEAVKEMSFTVKEGDFIGLIGQNGAGKSTLAKLLTGLLKPTNGKIELYGENSSELNRMDFAARIGYVFQNPDFQFFMNTCFDEVAFGLRLRKMPEEEIKNRVEKALDDMELLSYRDEHPHFLSRGERRRVSIATVLALEPKIIVLDEPTTGLDTGTSTRMLEVVKKLHESGHTIIMLTHEMKAVLEYCNRLILVKEGRIVLDDDPRIAFREWDLLHACDIRVPPVVEFMEALPWKKFPLIPRTSEELVDLILSSSIIIGK